MNFCNKELEKNFLRSALFILSEQFKTGYSMKRINLALLAIMFSQVAFAQNAKKEQDKESIKAMCGCYEVTFKYAETFRSDTAYDFRAPFITGASAEWIFVENKRRWERLFALQEKFTGDNSATIRKEVREIIELYLLNGYGE